MCKYMTKSQFCGTNAQSKCINLIYGASEGRENVYVIAGGGEILLTVLFPLFSNVLFEEIC